MTPPTAAPATVGTAPAVTRLADWTPPAWIARAVSLRVDLQSDHALVTSTVTYELAPQHAATDRLPELRLDGHDLQLVACRLDGADIPTEDRDLDPRQLVLRPRTAAFELTITTRLRPQDNRSMEGLYRSGTIWCTQMEAQGFRHMTYFQDRPDVLSVYTTTIEADHTLAPVLLGNGNLVDQGDLGDDRHFATFHDPWPKPCYLFALVAGPLGCVQDAFTTQSGRDVPLKIWCDPGNEARCHHAMASLKLAMAWDERVYGREYDLDVFHVVAVRDFNMGAMENKGLNIFNASRVLADARTATDEDFQRIEGVVAHEYFHNWSGNRVTCRDWFQLSLKEGFTVFRDQEFSADTNSRAVQRILDVRRLREMQFPEDAGPLAHPVRPSEYIKIDNFYTMTIYEKGAEIVRMLHTLLGPEDFRRGTDLYFERHDGQAVTTEEFVAAMEDSSGLDLQQFRRWYDQAGTPEVTVSGRWEAGPGDEGGTLVLDVDQAQSPTPGQPDKLPLHIPLELGLVGPDGVDLPLRLEGESAEDAAAAEARAASTGHGVRSRVLSITAPTESFRFPNLPACPVPSLNRRFAAPVILESDLVDEDLAFLVQHDGELFQRWESGQVLARRVLLSLVAERAENDGLLYDVLPPALITAFTGLLEGDADPALRAEALRLPTEIELAQAMDVIDVEGIHAVRENTTRLLAESCESRLSQLRESLGEPGAGVDAATIGRRSLRNTCLAYLSAIDRHRYTQLAHEQFLHASTMTDQLAALQILADVGGAEREQALDRFHHQWRDDPLVLDKWFEVQAASSHPDTLETIEKLCRVPDFDATNPNRVRALFATLSRNPAQFHRIDGKGYELMVGIILDVDRRNPILSGRLAGAFHAWARHDDRRRRLIEERLHHILDTAGLSDNVYEIVSKALGSGS